MTARCLAVWGTASDSGKSTLVTAFARLLVREGLRVAPFKAQNMARHAYVCADGGEIGVAQAVQARAARIEPSIDHNPVLLKPEPGFVSQVIVHGRSIGRHRFGDFHARAPELRHAIDASLARLRAENDVVLIEGAGSPAEINLQASDLANLYAARASDAQIVLVADIDRGGAFAALVGTTELVPDDLRPRIRGFILNKLHGDASLLDSGNRMIEQRTGIPVLGVVPHLGELSLPDEDSVALSRFRRGPRARLDEVEVAVVDTPCLANFEDALPFSFDPGVRLRLTSSAREVVEADLVILPGSKNTVHDLAFLRDRGLDVALERRAQRGRFVLGICGGTQILGRAIHDPERVESDAAESRGLALLPLETRFMPEKRTIRRRGVLSLGAAPEVEGFYLHHGHALVDAHAEPLVRFDDGSTDGAHVGPIVGTMLHRIADTRAARDELYRLAGVAPSSALVGALDEDPYDRLADAVARSIDPARLTRLLHGEMT